MRDRGFEEHSIQNVLSAADEHLASIQRGNPGQRHRLPAYYGPSISAPMLAMAGLEPEDFAPAARLAHDGRGAAELIDDRMLSLGVAGDAGDVVARCRVLRRLGASHLSFGPSLGPDPVAAIRLLGEQVLPALAEGGSLGGELAGEAE